MSGKVMGSLGTADGAVLRCLDILKARKSTNGPYAKPTTWELREIMVKLDTAHQAILCAAHELEKEQS